MDRFQSEVSLAGKNLTELRRTDLKASRKGPQRVAGISALASFKLLIQKLDKIRLGHKANLREHLAKANWISETLFQKLKQASQSLKNAL